MDISISKIADFLSCKIYGNDTRVNNIVIDSKKISIGDLFVAISGSNHDGHDYIQESINRGATAILCSDISRTYGINVPYIVCDNTIAALGIIARNIKKINGSPFTIGITGTNGKTSVTKLTSTILTQEFSVSTTVGNYNNDIGLPLSIFQSFNENTIHKSVYELGASKKNDIRDLVNICEPDLTTLLNVSEAHMESFGSFDNLISTKEEIFSHNNTSQVVLNKNDTYYQKWRELNNSKTITTVSINKEADYYISKSDDKYIYLSTSKGDFELDKRDLTGILPINLLFSISLAMEAGASISSVQKGVKQFYGVEGRFYSYMSSKNNSLIIDDSYNANPESMKSSLHQLGSFQQNKIFVMGDMGELGEKSLYHHQTIFKLAKDLGVEYLLYMGTYKDEAKSTFGENCVCFEDMDELINYVYQVSDENTVVLIKASRFMNFDLIAKGLK